MDIHDDGIDIDFKDKQFVKLKWPAIQMILISKYSICILPNDSSLIMMGISIENKEDIVSAIKKAKKEDMLIDNSDLYY